MFSAKFKPRSFLCFNGLLFINGKCRVFGISVDLMTLKLDIINWLVFAHFKVTVNTMKSGS